MKIVIFVFDHCTALDFVGPYEVLTKLDNSEVLFVGNSKGVHKDSSGLKVISDFSIDEISECDLLLVPGGIGIDLLLEDLNLLSWINKINKSTKWTLSVCSGALLLAAAGVLKSRRCTTHWRRKQMLEKYDVNIVNKRYVQDGKYFTSAGVSAGIDMALYFVKSNWGQESAEAIQLAIEYDPMPPVNSGSTTKASPIVIQKAQTVFAKNRKSL